MFPFQWFVGALCNFWVLREQEAVTAFLREENRVLRAHLRGPRLHVSDAERRRLAVLGHQVRRAAKLSSWILDFCARVPASQDTKRSCVHGHSALSGASGRQCGGPSHASGRPQCPRGVERRRRTGDDPPHDDHGAPSAALRPPASGARPRHWGCHYRHRSRGPSLDGPWMARQGIEGRGQPGRDGPEGIGTPARSLGTPATREEAHGTASARSRPTSKLGIHVDARASAPRTC